MHVFLRVLTILIVVFGSSGTSRGGFFETPIGEIFTIIKSGEPIETVRPQDFEPYGTIIVDTVLGNTISGDGSDPLSKPGATHQHNTIDQIPLKHTSVEGYIAGSVSRTYVTQTFENTASVPIEATYMFPLPNEASVDFMEMKIGEKVIQGVIEKKEIANLRYQEAKRQGKTAAVLNQERPNVFTQKIATIMPGDSIEITISYFQSIAYEKGEYTYVFPMVVGPRYTPASVKDPTAITSPTIPAWRTGHTIDVTLHIESGVPVQNINSPSHDLFVTKQSQNNVVITLQNEGEIPNKDLEVSYSLATDEKQIATLFHHEIDDDHGYLNLMVEPPLQPTPDEIINKEVIFVLDTSGSMNGRPITAVKKAMNHAIESLNEGDSFNIIDFNSTVTTLFDTPEDISRDSKKQGLQYIENLRAGGGTVMDKPLHHALSESGGDSGKVRTVLVMTDGDIGNEEEILRLITNELGENRIFVFGVDASANRYLLDRMSEIGRGKATYILNDAEINEKVDEFTSSFESPLLTNISIDRGEVRVFDILPTYLPDLYAGQPIRVSAKYDIQGKSQSTTITIKGWQGNTPYLQEIPIVFPNEESANDSIKSLRGRQQVKELYTLNRFEKNSLLEEEVTQLGLEYRIMTEYTSFIAIDETIRNHGGNHLPVEVPKYQVYGKQELGQNRGYSIQQEAQEKGLSRSNNTLRYTNSYESSDMASNTNQLSNVSLSMVGAGVGQQDASVGSISTSIKRVVIFMVAIGALLFLLGVSRIYLYKNTEFEHRYQTAKRIRKRGIRIVLGGVCVWFITVIITVFTS